jgi:hypothetical protein
MAKDAKSPNTCRGPNSVIRLKGRSTSALGTLQQQKEEKPPSTKTLESHNVKIILSGL